MKLTGWEQISEVEWKSKKRRLKVIYYDMSIGDNPYIVVTKDIKDGIERIIARSFDRKDSAISFSRRYMRSHPEG